MLLHFRWRTHRPSQTGMAWVRMGAAWTLIYREMSDTVNICRFVSGHSWMWSMLTKFVLVLKVGFQLLYVIFRGSSALTRDCYMLLSMALQQLFQCEIEIKARTLPFWLWRLISSRGLLLFWRVTVCWQRFLPGLDCSLPFSVNLSHCPAAHSIDICLFLCISIF